jgi:hypothetical protein
LPAKIAVITGKETTPASSLEQFAAENSLNTR